MHCLFMIAQPYGKVTTTVFIFWLNMWVCQMPSLKAAITAVVKVRRTRAGERRSWAPKIAGEHLIHMPHTAVSCTSRLKGAPLVYSRAPNFVRVHGSPNVYFNHCIYT